MFEISLLRTFLAVADARHFTGAGVKLGINQSTVSQQIRRLEATCGRQLFTRDTHTVNLTADGAVLADHARRILDIDQQASDYFSDSAPRGRVRLGVSDDVTLTRLSSLLREIRRSNPLLSIELMVGLTNKLYQKLDSGWLDIVFAKRLNDDARGISIHRERLVWIGHEDFQLNRTDPVPLILYPSSSITSTLAMEALNAARRPWFVACSSETLNGIRAGTQAGLGVMAQSRLLLADRGSNLVQMSSDSGLPQLGEVEFVVLGRSAKLTGAIAAFAEIIIEKGPSLWDLDSPATAVG